jgi:hypothetical protein
MVGSVEASGEQPAADLALAALLTELLQRRLRQVIGAEWFNGQDRLIDWRFGLVDGVEPGVMTARLQAMSLRLTRPECAMILMLNSFLAWQDSLAGLRLAGGGGFTELFVATRCPTGVRGTPPSVDVVASAPDHVVAGTVRVFDYLAPRRVALSAGRRTLQVEKGVMPWVDLIHDAPAFAHVDVAGLAKLAIGLGRIFRNRPVRLLYLFLEPRNPETAIFTAHRAEIARVDHRLAGSDVGFAASSLHELWQGWCGEDTPLGVRSIAAELARRYGVAMPRRGPL